MGVCLLLALSLTSLPSPTAEGFAEFVNRDLTKLNKAEEAKLDSLCKSLLPSENRRPLSFGPSPRWIKPYATGSIKWLFLWIAQLYSIPGASYARAYGFDERWKLIRQYDFPTGYRLWFESERLWEDRWFPQPILTITVRSEGPFIVMEGQPARPLFHPETEMRQHYTFSENGAHLIRLERGEKHLMSSGYGNGNSSIGPETANRGLKAWTDDLNSADPGRQLQCLIWLSGRHLNSKDWRKEGYARESVKDSMDYESMRSDKAILDRIRKLGESRHPWLKEQAAYTLESLSMPLEEISKPPGE